MSRIPLIDPESTTGSVREMFDRLPAKANVFRAMAHAETCMPALVRLGGSIMVKQKLPHRERELLVLQAMEIEQGRYEWEQHVPIALGLGISDAQIAALKRQDYAAPCFDERDRALLAFGSAVTRDVRVSEPVYTAMKAHFSDREIVEAIIAIGYYMMLARLTEATDIEIDMGLGPKVFQGAQDAAQKRKKDG